MKNFIKSIILFIPFCIISYLIFIIIWGEVIPIKLNNNIKYRIGSYGHLHTRINEVDDYKDIDILFLGNSLAYRGFDVRYYEKIGLKVFNLGSSGQTPIQTQILVNRYLDSLNPKIVIYAAPSFSGDGVESSLDLIANDKKDFLTLKMMSEIKNLKTINTGVFGFYRSIFNRDKGYYENRIKKKDTYISGGFVESEISHYSPSADKYTKPTKTPTDNEVAYQKESFEQIIKELNIRNIKIIIISPPITKKHYISNINRANYMSSKAEYYDFNLLLNLNDSACFYDTHHLNQNGVDVFNKKIIEILRLEEYAQQARTHNILYK